MENTLRDKMKIELLLCNEFHRWLDDSKAILDWVKLADDHLLLHIHRRFVIDEKKFDQF